MGVERIPNSEVFTDLPSSKRRHQAEAEADSSEGGGQRSPDRVDLLTLAGDIAGSTAAIDPTDDIHRCGTAVLRILGKRPQEALDLAHTKLHSWPYHQLPRHWRRLYEDASLLLAAQLLKRWAADQPWRPPPTKRSKPSDGCGGRDGPLGPIVATLDKAVIISGAPTRKGYIENVLARLGRLVHVSDQEHGGGGGGGSSSAGLSIIRPRVSLSSEQLPRTVTPISLEEFQAHLDRSGQPIIIPKAFEHWPASQRWASLPYLLHATLDGTRLVPIEIGDNYTDESWTQRLVPFSEFVQKYLAPKDPADTGYLAQHDLFEHIPALRQDISIPDYCYTAPPPPSGAALLTPGLSGTLPVDDPLLNAWLGPEGTKTPLHTDPYHNILCQVVGYKYIRLYPPEETPKLYPRSADEAGVDMANTTQIDVQHFRPGRSGGNKPVRARPGSELSEAFPLFPQAKYQEAILAPGECLYIPLGWWHYVESLTTSFSVSFWWN